ncbi:Dyp-type peroxidase [Microbacterium sp. zg-Y818]|uniref:Dyp-type peroxidase n=1 Tax=unclassified Microbacterium TaxID=2609290 RepID=UPI00214B29FF|nr:MULTISPECIES: Dyp-type peroxidase [unclassified Microbacterium]MCR2799850.1 Dyp-type peroxidase [Microbacterium sp. zg.Y818]WIM21833.1 Dyp-type peroxidase [Microbacterium sp. zg-Y818]
MSTGHGRVSRRGLLLGGAGVGLGVVAGAAGAAMMRPPAAPLAGPDGGGPTSAVPARGRHQAGVDRPATPQRSALVVVLDLPAASARNDVRTAVAALGDAVEGCTDGADPTLMPDGPGDLAVTIGLGPRLVRLIDPALPGAQDLPDFAGDDAIAREARGGDVLLAIYASDPNALPIVAGRLRDALPGSRIRWQQSGVRGPGEGTVARNPLGYHDGVMVPEGAELDDAVWIADGPAAAGTIAVIRRLRLNVEAFHDLSRRERDRVIGRERTSGAPLSGGDVHDGVDLTAKTPEGEYVVPARAHVRAAHPSFTGSALMLRRSYGYANGVDATGAPDDGILFMCFQHDVDVFVRTQVRLDESDDLMRFARPTASATFLIPPGRTGDEPFGAALFRPS